MNTLLASLAGTAAAASALTATGAIGLRVEPIVADAPAGMSVSQQERVDKAASASLFGQFRSSMADFLWLKVDKYLHNGVDLRGLTPLEKEAKTADRVTSAKGEEGNREHRGETTVVPSRAHDWRGLYGDVEREVQPYMDMEGHKHRDPKEALPLFRLMTWSNPHFIPGYVTGAMLIARDPKHYEQAVAFLQEGERNNPTSIEIDNALGMMYTAKLRQYSTAIPYLTHAIALSTARDPQTLSDDENDAYQGSYRWLVLCERESGDQITARKVALAGQARFPDDVVCRDYLNTHK